MSRYSIGNDGRPPCIATATRTVCGKPTSHHCTSSIGMHHAPAGHVLQHLAREVERLQVAINLVERHFLVLARRSSLGTSPLDG